MKNQINIRFVYGISHQVFNVGENGTKTHYDPVFGRYYIYGSAGNVKHNIKDEFADTMGLDVPVQYFEKDIKKIVKEGKEAQGGVATEIDVTNPIASVFGAWNSTIARYKNLGKYAKAAIKSSFNVSELHPIHTLLSAKKQDCGVNVGDYNSRLAFTTKGEKEGEEGGRAFTPEELAENGNISLEQAVDFFKNTRKMNFYKENENTNGIYILDICIDFRSFWRLNLTDNPDVVTDEEKDELIANGWSLQTYKNKQYLVPPVELIEDCYNNFVEALFNWDFTSNNSLHGSKKELLRVSFTDSDIVTWQQCTSADYTKHEDGRDTAVLKFIDGVDGVYSYNTLLLNKYYDNSDGSINEPYLTAHKDAKKKLVELGNSIIESL